MADAVVVNGGTLGPGAVYGDACVFTGAVIVSTSTFGKGCTFINCSFTRGSKYSAHSVVGEGGTMSGGSARWVDFDSTGVWSNVSNQGDTTPPDCVDCAPQSAPPVLSVGTHADVQLVNMAGVITRADWRAAIAANCVNGAPSGPLVLEPSGPGFTFSQNGATVTRT